MTVSLVDWLHRNRLLRISVTTNIIILTHVFKYCQLLDNQWTIISLFMAKWEMVINEQGQKPFSIWIFHNIE
jgi:hypothetical protein